MNKDLELSTSVAINATPEKIWNTLTDPELIKEYLYGTQTQTDWKVGSEIIFQGEYQGKSYRDKGVILTVTPNRLIRYSYWSGFSGLEDKPENYSIITYTLTPENNGQTRFTWTQTGFASEEGKKHSESGMPGLLEQIKQISER